MMEMSRRKRVTLTIVAFLASVMLTPLLVLGPLRIHDLMKIFLPFIAAPIVNALFFHTLGMTQKAAWWRGTVVGWAGVLVAWAFLLYFLLYFRKE